MRGAIQGPVRLEEKRGVCPCAREAHAGVKQRQAGRGEGVLPLPPPRHSRRCTKDKGFAGRINKKLRPVRGKEGLQKSVCGGAQGGKRRDDQEGGRIKIKRQGDGRDEDRRDRDPNRTAFRSSGLGMLKIWRGSRSGEGQDHRSLQRSRRRRDLAELAVKLVDAEALADAAQLRHKLGDLLDGLDLSVVGMCWEVWLLVWCCCLVLSSHCCWRFGEWVGLGFSRSAQLNTHRSTQLHATTDNTQTP